MRGRVRDLLGSNSVVVVLSIVAVGAGTYLNVKSPSPESTNGLIIGAMILAWFITALLNLSGREPPEVLNILKYEAGVFFFLLVPWAVMTQRPGSFNPWTILETTVVLLVYLFVITLIVYLGKIVARWARSEQTSSA